MSRRSAELLLKAVQGLPAEEQDEMLIALFEGRAFSVGVLGLPGSVTSPPLSPLLPQVMPRAPAVTAAPVQFTVPLSGEVAPPELSQLRAASQSNEGALRVLPVRLPAEDYERLRAWSKEHDFSMAVIIRTLVERFLDSQQPAEPRAAKGRGRSAGQDRRSAQ